MGTYDDRILTTEALLPIIERLKSEGKVVVFTNGCFDLLHVGHVRYLAEAKAAGDVLVLGLNSDKSVRALKGPGRPITSEAERAEILVSLKSVDYVLIFDDPDPLRLILAVRPDVLVKGEDWEEEDIVGASEVRSWGGKVIRAKQKEGSSTTGLIERIKKVK
jgi:D-beta-D-heptose 7-phosphate kinase/D-beta-D-heptose 1-phosphate adenosyltransferase